MHSAKLYPNYIDNYYYEKGDKCILLKRSNGVKITYTHTLIFDTPDEAENYFNNNCGA